jgi:serine/threonine-protein kinase HipA
LLLIVPNSNVLRLQDKITIVVEWYDRAPENRWVRIHQEDMCQVLGLSLTRKYESDSEPGVQRIMEL